MLTVTSLQPTANGRQEGEELGAWPRLQKEGCSNTASGPRCYNTGGDVIGNQSKT